MWFIFENEISQLIIEAETYPPMKIDGIYYTSSRGYKDKEELDKALLPEPCVICGRRVHHNFMEPVKQQMIAKNMCFSCNLWDNRASESPDNRMIVRHSMYTVSDEKASHFMRGFGGARFKFKSLKDGKVTESTNVWFGGDIPKYFWERMPDNAEMI